MAQNPKTSPLFILVAMITAVAALYFAKEILLPVALAVLLSFLLTPLANRLERWRIPRMLSVVLVVAMSFSVLGLLGWVVTNQLVELGHQQSVTEQSLSKKTKWIFDKINLVVNGVSHFGKHPDTPAAEKNADG